MNTRNTYVLIGLAVLAVVGVLFYRQSQAKAKYDWRDSWIAEAYSEKNPQPYGTQLLYRLLDTYFAGHPLKTIQEGVAGELPLQPAQAANYVFVGEGLYLDSLSTVRLLAFVENGNTALLSSKTIPFDLMFHLYFRECADAEWNDYEKKRDSVVQVSLRQPALPAPVSLHFAWQNTPKAYQWSFMEADFFCDSLPQRPLGYLNDSLINFAEFPYGKGRFLLHTTPIAFSNYQLLRPEARSYAEGILSHLQNGDIYWDATSRVPEMVARQRNNRNNGGSYARDLEAEHPFSYILKHPSLAWAWYLLIGLSLAYLVFRAKRRKRIIPVLPKNENSSYEFISTIANLHFREKNYQNICIQQMRLFLAQLREKYGMVVQLHPETQQPRIDSSFVSRLSQVSEVPVPQIQNIFTQYAATTQYEPTEEMMVDFHLALEAFGKQAK